MAQFNPIQVPSPNVLGAIQQGQQIRSQFDLRGRQQEQDQLQQQQAEQQQQSQNLAGKIASGAGTNQDVSALLSANPEMADKALNSLGLNDQRKRDDASRFAFELESTPFDQRMIKINCIPLGEKEEDQEGNI